MYVYKVPYAHVYNNNTIAWGDATTEKRPPRTSSAIWIFSINVETRRYIVLGLLESVEKRIVHN